MDVLNAMDLIATWAYVALVAFVAIFLVAAFTSEKRELERWESRRRAMLEKEPSQESRDVAYQMLNGDLNLEDTRISTLRPQIDALENKVYQHRMKLCARAGLDFEDADLEGIISAYERLNRLCADGMYDQGWHAAAHQWSLLRGEQSKKSKTRKTNPKT